MRKIVLPVLLILLLSGCENKDKGSFTVSGTLINPPAKVVYIEENNIKSIIWTTGFTGDFSWIKLPVINERGNPIHNDGISPVKHLYFNGLPWLRNLKSSLILGSIGDAEAVTSYVLENHHETIKAMA